MTLKSDAFLSLFIAPLPKRERMRLLLDVSFCSKLHLTQDLFLSVGTKVAVDVKSLHAALRSGLKGKKFAAVKLKNGSELRAKLELNKGGKVTITIKKERLLFDHVDLLNDDHKIRTEALIRTFQAQPFPSIEEDTWLEIVRARYLDHQEFFKLMNDLSLTPEAFAHEVQKPGDLSLDRMMPSDSNYYERLTAKLGASKDCNSFIATELFDARRSLLERSPTQGLRCVAFSALWQPLIPFVLLSNLTKENVRPLLDAEDPFSLLFGFELCCAQLLSDNSFAELGAKFLTKLFDDPVSSKKRFEIFSACAIVAMSQIKLSAKAADKPIFWTRLAALTHAGVLADSLSQISDSKDFMNWITGNFWPQYFWSGLADRHTSPKWRPEWITPRHLFAEVVGRAINPILMLPELQRPNIWISSIDAAKQRLAADGALVATTFPGPFDDFRSLDESPHFEEFFAEIELKLKTAKSISEVDGFNALNYATVPTAAIVSNVESLFERNADDPFENMQLELAELRLGAHFALVGKSVVTAGAIINRCKFLIYHKCDNDHMSDLLAIMLEACAVHGTTSEYRSALSDVSTWMAYAFDDAKRLAELTFVFSHLTSQDEKLIPTLARAKSILRMKLQKH